MGKNGEAHSTMISYQTTYGKTTKYHSYGVTVDIEVASTLVDFEVIEIVDDSNPYLALLGIDWAFDMDVIINIKNHRMKFERKELRVIIPLDPTEGVRYNEPVHDYEEDDLDQIYKITVQNEEWINPTVDGWMTFDRDSSYTSNFEEELEHW